MNTVGYRYPYATHRRRTKESSAVLTLGRDASTLQRLEYWQVSPLRRPRNLDRPDVVRLLAVRSGRRSSTRSGLQPRSDRQRRELRALKRAMGNLVRAESQSVEACREADAGALHSRSRLRSQVRQEEEERRQPILPRMCAGMARGVRRTASSRSWMEQA